MDITQVCDQGTTIIVAKVATIRERKDAQELHHTTEVHTMAKGAEQKRPRIRIRVPVPKPGAAHKDKSKYNRKRKHQRRNK